jgi:PEGA domain-containing protein
MASAPAAAQVTNPASAEVAAADKSAHAKDWTAALAHYQAALLVAPSARAQLGAADALYQLGRLGEAYDAYAEAQRIYAPKLAAADKALLTTRLKDLAAKTGALAVHVEEAGADVQVDGKSLGTSPVAALLRLPVGPHAVRVTKTGYLPFAADADVTPDGKAVMDPPPLVRQPSLGHLVVHAPGSEPLRVLIDGVDLGATPWEGDLAAGPHEIGGRSSSSQASAQMVNVNVGDRIAVDLVTAATGAHLQMRTSDGKGQVYLDGVAKGDGAFIGDVAPGPHTVVITRDGYERFEKTLTLAERETWAETVTLKPATVPGASAQLAERAFEGIYGGFGLTGLFAVGGQGTDLETRCDGLGASSCDTPGAIGGGAFGYVGWTWDPVGFELMLAGSGDTVQETAHFGTGAAAANPLAQPPRDEKFTFARFGGMAALRVRASVQGRLLRGTIAGGVGLSYKKMVMERRTTTTDGTNRTDGYVPGDDVAYVSPAITIEAALQFRVTPTIALAVGLETWAENASIAGSNSVPPGTGRLLTAANQTPAAIATPAYHLATGPQVFLGPFLGMQFGP